MNEAGQDCIANQLDDWRERGEDSLAPLRFYFIEALHKRLARQDGDVARVLRERLSRQLRAYKEEVVAPARLCGQLDAGSQSAHKTVAGPLAELLEHAASRPSALILDSELIDYFRNTWASVSANRMLRQSSEQVPDNAGPLNSSGLAYRSLILMQTLSPGYLQHFLSYIDALSWMEQVNDDRNRVDDKSAIAGKRKPAQRKA